MASDWPSVATERAILRAFAAWLCREGLTERAGLRVTEQIGRRTTQRRATAEEYGVMVERYLQEQADGQKRQPL